MRYIIMLRLKVNQKIYKFMTKPWICFKKNNYIINATLNFLANDFLDVSENESETDSSKVDTFNSQTSCMPTQAADAQEINTDEEIILECKPDVVALTEMMMMNTSGKVQEIKGNVFDSYIQSESTFRNTITFLCEIIFYKFLRDLPFTTTIAYKWSNN